MSTIVCQNLISCFDSQMTAEATTLKLTVKTLDLSKNNNHDVRSSANLEFGNWSFIQTTVNPKEVLDHKEACYSQPWVAKPSLCKLTARSLELCTENLGSETGSDIITDDSTIFRSPNSSEISTTSFEEQTATNSPTRNTYRREAKSPRKMADFPPPLTTMISSNSLQVRRRREGGRLIMEAVQTPFGKSYLQAERRDGRLRMRCFTPPTELASCASSSDDDEEEEEGEEEKWDGETAAAEEERTEGGGNEKEELIEGEVNTLEKFQQRLGRRCSDGSHGSKEMLSNWKPAALWVATS